jgi:hypothetical protein
VNYKDNYSLPRFDCHHPLHPMTSREFTVRKQKEKGGVIEVRMMRISHSLLFLSGLDYKIFTSF